MAKFGKVAWKVDRKAKIPEDPLEYFRKSFFQYYNAQLPSKETLEYTKIFQQ